MSGFIKGVNRSQSTLFPESLDDFVIAENTVRVIDVFIEALDLAALGFAGMIIKSTGRPKYHPAVMLKLYLYGYLNRVQSSRRLEVEANRNIELMWLLERLAPDFKTIADFRKNNAKGIKHVCRTFVQLCRQLHMFDEGEIAIDGSKFKASNNKDNNYTPKKMAFHIERVEKHISNYLEKLDRADEEQHSPQTIKATQETISNLKQKLAELKILEKEVKDHPEKQISTTDPDSRLMKTQGMTRVVSYNIQSAVDTKHHLIVAHEVTNSTDRGQLCPTAVLAQHALKRKDLTVIADKGYFSGQDIKDTQDAGMTPLVPKGDTSGSDKKGIFNRSKFTYDKEKDVYICPNNSQLMPGKTMTKDRDLYLMHYRARVKDCRQCSLQPQCTKSATPRKITRWEHQDRIDNMDKLMKKRPDLMLIRKQSVEHPFGTIKCWMGMTHLLTRRFKNVRTEMNLHVLAYNFKRMLNIMGIEGLMDAIKAKI
jgi:transposase